MPRHENHATPKVVSVSGLLYTDDINTTGTRLDTHAWFVWLATASTFYYESPLGSFTAHCEARRRGGRYWIAYRRQAGLLRRMHLGKPDRLTALCLAQTAVTLQTPVQSKHKE